MSKSYYDILGIDKNATQDEIKKAFRNISKKYHPDKNPGDKVAEEKFKEAAEAYETLSDKDKKMQYDWQQELGNQTDDPWSHFGGFGGFNPFGGFRQRKPVEKGGDVYVNVDVTLEDIYNEKEIEVKYNKHNPCHHCNGTGAKDGKVKTCPDCQGTGFILRTSVQGNMTFSTQSVCQRCSGKGEIAVEQCKHCNGSGQQNSPATIRIKVPKEAFEGANMLFEGHGDMPKSKNGIPGNLVVVFHVKANSYFRITSNGLVHDEFVPFTDCLLGCTREVKTVNGKTIKVNVPELTPSGTKYTFNEGGMWNKPYTVYIKYKLPDKLTDRQKEILKEFNDGKN